MTEPFQKSTSFIAGPAGEELERSRPVRFRTAFLAAATVVSATLRVTACGVYQASINGQSVGDEVLAPGWTGYKHRHRYQTHDATALVTQGGNAIGIEVAEGWYRGRLGFWSGATEIYGTEIGPFAELELIFADGTNSVVGTDSTWQWAPSPTLAASLYDGETYDQRLETADWATAAASLTEWQPVRVVAFDTSVLFAADSPPIRRTAELQSVAITTSPTGKTLVDFGQNIAGRIRVQLPKVADCEITLRPAEVLDAGEIGVRPLRGARCTDIVITSGEGGWWEPAFTFHGFRFVEVTGWPGDVTADDLVAVACHSDMEPTGTFTCSNDLLNRLHDNVIWSMRGNFIDIPTDCPQRDERLGWTGDIQVFAPTASFLYDCRTFLASWLKDLAHDQADWGAVPVWVPYFKLFPLGEYPTAAWSDAAVVVPWVLYERFGDIDTLAQQYPSMTAHVDQVADMFGPSHLSPTDRLQLGDWLDPSSPSDNPAKTRTDPFLVATAYHAYTARLLAGAAAVLGRIDDVAKYHALADEVAAAFRGEYTSSNGRLVSDSPTAFAVAIMFDLLTAEQLPVAGARLRALVEADRFHIGTGFVGTPLICDALVRVGETETAFHMLTQTTCPSWLYPVTMGATTTWERWDSMLPDGSINPGDMTSFNHYALGAVADFLHRRIAGLAPGAPGYSVIDVRPLPGGGLTSAAATHRTPYGEAAVSWHRTDDTFHLTLTIPTGTTAVVALPDGSADIGVGEGTHTMSCPFRSPQDDPARPEPRNPFG